MYENAAFTLVSLLAISVLGAFCVLWLHGLFLTRNRETAKNITPSLDNTVLLRNGVVEDHDVNMHGVMDRIQDWVDMRTWLSGRFANLPEYLPDDATQIQTFRTHDIAEDKATLSIDAYAGVTRVTLNDPIECQPADRHQAIRLKTLLAEDHAALENSPCAIWKTDLATNEVIWRNTSCERLLGEGVHEVLSQFATGLEEADTTSQRLAIERPNEKAKTWFDVHLISAEQSHIYYAVDVTNAVLAEAAQREFVQTLTKTFANLTTGLAIFDRKKQLALFNPALVDLTALPAEFLSGRPSLMSFFDNLRDRQVMPEPKNYSDWRTQINAMIETASDGLYQETWSLPTGATYRVTGRPHPDGAVAFLFEDITAEISLTRRFRAQNDLRQSVLDMLDHAVAVIAANNVVIFCNATWTEMFGVDPDTSFAELSIRDLVAICKQKYPHPDFWNTVETQTTNNTLSRPIEDVIALEDGSELHCRLVPASGGAAIICRVPDVATKTQRTSSTAS